MSQSLLGAPPVKKSVSPVDYRATAMFLWNKGEHFAAMKLMFRKRIVDCPPTRRLVTALHEHRRLLVHGHGSASKTFTTVAARLMKWWSNPTRTSLVLTSATIRSLGSRAWADLLLLFHDAAVPMPGVPYQSIYEIRHDRNDRKHKILCVAGEDERSATKIQGLHPEFMDVVIDEADNPYNTAIWDAIANLGTSGIVTVAALANPVDRNSRFGLHAEPEDGWSSLDKDSSHSWMGGTGYFNLRLDGLDSPNIVAERVAKASGALDPAATLDAVPYPFLLTPRGVKDIVTEFGENSPNYLTMVRAWFPESGAVNTVFTGELVARMEKQEIVFYGGATPVAACDPSLGGGNRCVVALGRAGLLASDPRKGCLIIEKFVYVHAEKNHAGLGTVVTSQFGRKIKEIALAHGVEPKNFAIDASAATRGISDFIREDWSNEIIAMEFAGKATRRKILQEDTRLPVDRFDRFNTEFWWAAREWVRAAQMKVECINRDLRIQLESRRWKVIEGRNVIRLETKEEMAKRGLKSPDESDAVCLTLEVVRRNFGDLEATGLDFDPAVRNVASPSAPSDYSSTLQPDYKSDAVLGDDARSRLPERNDDDQYERYGNQDIQ